MSSKQEKRKYGQILRQQMKQKEEQKRGNKITRIQNEPIELTPQHQPKIQSNVNYQPTELPKTDRQRQKQLLIKQMENIDYNPFGRGGSGAPIKQSLHIPASQPQNNHPRIEENAYQRNSYNRNIQNPSPKYNPNPIKIQNFERIPTPQFLEGAYNSPLVSPYYAPFGYINKAEQQQKYDYNAANNRVNYPPQTTAHHPSIHQVPVEMVNSPPMMAPQQKENQRLSNGDNELEIHKGGRNLLKVQNQDPSKVIQKQNEKIKLQKILKEQMEEVQRKKKLEKQKNRRQDQQLQVKNKMYIDQEKKKFQEEAKKQKEKENPKPQNNKAQLPDLKRQKFRKIRQQVAKRQAEERRVQHPPTPPIKQEYHQKQPQKNNNFDDFQSVSSDSQVSKGFNTAISKQFFQREKQKSSQNQKKSEISGQMKKIRQQIHNQGQFYQNQLEKVRYEAERANKQKTMAQNEIQHLKKQLKNRMDENNKLYLNKIYDGKVNVKDPYYADEVSLKQNYPVQTLKQKKGDELVLTQFDPSQSSPRQTKKFNANESLISLDGTSKKIPLEMQTSRALSVSQLSDYAKETRFFKKDKPSQKYQTPQSIKEVDEQRLESKQSSRQTRHMKRRQNDELDKLIVQRGKSRGGWGQMSSVNEDITDQIDKMLRPRSNLSKAGEQSLKRNSKDIDPYGDQLNRYRGYSHKVEQNNINSSLQIDRLEDLLDKYKQ